MSDEKQSWYVAKVFNEDWWMCPVRGAICPVKDYPTKEVLKDVQE